MRTTRQANFDANDISDETVADNLRCLVKRGKRTLPGAGLPDDPIVLNRSDDCLLLRDGVPAISSYREFAVAGGLMSYVPDDMARAAGIYTGRILRGDKPADLPVQQAAKSALIINLKTAESLGITFPTALLVRADEVIE